MKKMISILYITHSCPYPPNKGDRIRSFNIIKHLSKIYDIKIIYPYYSKHDYEKVTEDTPKSDMILMKANPLCEVVRQG